MYLIKRCYICFACTITALLHMVSYKYLQKRTIKLILEIESALGQKKEKKNRICSKTECKITENANQSTKTREKLSSKQKKKKKKNMIYYFPHQTINILFKASASYTFLIQEYISDCNYCQGDGVYRFPN